jgi:hypothetical protein
MDDKKKEVVITSATYGNHEIHLTTWKRLIVEVYAIFYPVKSLDEAKKMIDDLKKTRRN